MGNVLAASSQSSSRSTSATLDKTQLRPPEPLLPKPETEPETEENRYSLNPGTVEELHKKCKDIQATPFEGARVMLNKGLSNHFQISHTLNLSSTQPSGYRFGATYVGTKHLSAADVYPVLLGDIDPSGNLNANIIHQFTPRLRCKFVSQIQDSKMSLFQMTTDYRARKFTASLTAGNVSLFTNSGIVVGHYLQRVNKNVALGLEVAHQYGPNVPGRSITIISGVGRYSTDNYTWSGSLGFGGFHACYYHKASDQLQIGVEVETSIRLQESIATIGYQVDLPKADLVFRGSVDTNWTVCGVLEKRLQPMPFSFALSGRLNHTKNQFRLGFGFIIG